MFSNRNLKILIYLSVILIIGSLLYDLIFINLPFQDPSEEMVLERQCQIFKKEIALYSGLSILLIVFVVKILRYLKR